MLRTVPLKENGLMGEGKKYTAVHKVGIKNFRLIPVFIPIYSHQKSIKD